MGKRLKRTGLESVLAEIHYFLFWFGAFAAILKICK